MAATAKDLVDDAAAIAFRGEFDRLLPLRHAGPQAVTLRFELTGHANAPLMVVAGGISAGRHVISSTEFAEPGWWEPQRTTLAQARVLAIDWIGADGTLDVPIDPSDQALAIATVLDHLGIGRIAGFVGASYGAMVGLQFAAAFPDRIGRLLSVSASDRAHPFSSACRSVQRKVVALGERGGDPAAGVALARALAMLTYRTADEYRGRFNQRPTVVGGEMRVSADDYLDFQGARYAERTSGPAYRRLSESIDLHCVDPSDINLPATFVAVESDWLVPIEDIRALADSVSGARFILMPSLYGHDGFLKEQGQVAAILDEFIDTLEQHR